MGNIEVVDSVITVPLSELKSGDIFQMDQNFFIMSFVMKPKLNQGTIKNNFYQASVAKNEINDSCMGLFLITNLETGEVSIETINYKVFKVNAKLMVNRVRENVYESR